jgi:hypothetical protein
MVIKIQPSNNWNGLSVGNEMYVLVILSTLQPKKARKRKMRTYSVQRGGE